MGNLIELDKIEATIEWLDSVFPNSNFSQRELSPVFGFSLLWNLFERVQSKESGSDFTAKSLIKIGLVDFDKVSKTKLDDIFGHFIGRYVLDEIKGAGRLNNLGLEKYRDNVKPFGQSVKDFITTSLIADQKEPDKKMTAVMLIIYRFRNNLFHGSKDTLVLNKFAAEFTIINQFLREYLAAKLTPKP